MNAAKIELNMSPERFAKVLDDIEYGREFGYGQKVQDAICALYKAASKEDQARIVEAQSGKYEWLRAN